LLLPSSSQLITIEYLPKSPHVNEPVNAFLEFTSASILTDTDSPAGIVTLDIVSDQVADSPFPLSLTSPTSFPSIYR
jgi:hypothetical protein